MYLLYIQNLSESRQTFTGYDQLRLRKHEWMHNKMIKRKSITRSSLAKKFEKKMTQKTNWNLSQIDVGELNMSEERNGTGM